MAFENIEFFRATVQRCNNCDAEVMDRVEEMRHLSTCAAKDEQPEESKGIFFWYCFPGCLPESDPFGPYETIEEARKAACEVYDLDDNGEELAD